MIPQKVMCNLRYAKLTKLWSTGANKFWILERGLRIVKYHYRSFVYVSLILGILGNLAHFRHFLI